MKALLFWVGDVPYPLRKVWGNCYLINCAIILLQMQCLRILRLRTCRHFPTQQGTYGHLVLLAGLTSPMLEESIDEEVKITNHQHNDTYLDVFTVQSGFTKFFLCSIIEWIPSYHKSELGVPRVSGTAMSVGEICRLRPFVWQGRVTVTSSFAHFTPAGHGIVSHRSQCCSGAKIDGFW